MSLEYVIYADESDDTGEYYSNFFGGVLVKSSDLLGCVESLQLAKNRNNLRGEVKWQKVTEPYLDKYKRLMDVFFDLIETKKTKVRLMFTCNAHVPVGLENRHRKNKYTLLYYQFLKHGFGLKHSPPHERATARVYLDSMPITEVQRTEFRSHVARLSQDWDFQDAQVEIPEEQITEVDSRDHVLLQAIDIVLGAMQFKLNDKHKAIPEGRSRRGKRTVAKHELYKHIHGRICKIRPHFNIGISTGTDGTMSSAWAHPYRHWCFKPKNTKIDTAKFKP